MAWIVQKKINGVWAEIATFPTRKRARTAVQGTKSLFPCGDKYRVRSDSRAKLGEGLDELVLVDLLTVLGDDVKAHVKICTRSCGVAWLVRQFKLAGLLG